jgi:hypothetical protein
MWSVQSLRVAALVDQRLSCLSYLRSSGSVEFSLPRLSSNASQIDGILALGQAKKQLGSSV